MAKKMVLVVDDDEKLREVMVAFLEHLGYKVMGLGDGKPVLHFCMQLVPDLVISDIRMPELDGISLLRGLKHRKETNKIPVILISGYADDEMMESARQLGAIFFLRKPFPVDALEQIVTKALPPQ